MTDERWTQQNSETYRQLAAAAVPARQEQVAALLTLLPFGREERFRVVELASGEGRLSYAILSAYPHAQLLALDLEDSMRAETAQRLRAFGQRAQVAPFDMLAAGWFPLLEGADAVVSSLCIHHLTGPQKQALFAAVSARLSPCGALLIADLVNAPRDEVRRFFAATWDHATRAQSIAQAGDERLYELFANEHWNYFHYPDPFDKPSPLFDQLMWLKEAGFAVVDCFWMQAGHAIYGGYKAYEASQVGEPLAYNTALDIARRALG